MIKIPENKYLNLSEEHYNYISDYIKDSIQFYINCCDIWQGKILATEYRRNLSTNITEKRIYKLLRVICDCLPPKMKAAVFFQERYKLQNLKQEFRTQIFIYKSLLCELLESSSTIYLKRIIVGDPYEENKIMQYLAHNYKNILDSKGDCVFDAKGIKKSIIYDILKNCFDYDRFSGKNTSMSYSNTWNAYELCKKLNIRVCPYCNRNEIVTVISSSGKYICRPELDHYMPQSLFPIFSVSFFNLIPCCKSCNSSIKGGEYLDITKYYHPYLDGIEKAMFSYRPLSVEAFEGNPTAVEVIIKSDIGNKYEDTINKFKLKEVYKEYNKVVADMLCKRQKYSLGTIEEMKKSIGIISETKENIINLLFDVCKTADIIDTPLGKMKRDLVDEFYNSQIDI